MTTKAQKITGTGDTATAPYRVGFVGLGDMGGRIARRIAESGFPLTVFDRRPDAVADLVHYGADGAPDARAVAAASDVVCVCVVDDDQVRGVVSELTLRPGSTLVIHSSVLPQTVQDIGAELSPGGAYVADVPVSGSRPAADDGTLTALVGGEPSVVAALRPLLSTYCANVIHAGPLGAGSLLKIANNVMLHMNHLIAVEAARFARAHGIEESALIKAANVSTGRSWVTETWGLLDDMLLDHPLRGTEGVYEIMSKEMWHAVQISRASLLPMQLTALGTQVSKSYFREREELLEAMRRPADGGRRT
jgi:3-hydroxyisobutyrate dehydrogenase